MNIPIVKLITDTNDLPDISGEKEIGLDVETYDPELKTLGPGPRRTGYIVGFSIATTDQACYVPVRHGCGPNIPPENLKNWISSQIFRPGLKKVGHNITYDLDHFQESTLVHGPKTVHRGGPYEDTYTNELLLHDDKFVKKSLEETATRRLGFGKFEDELKQSAQKYGIKDIKKELWKMSGVDVAQYGGLDSWLSLQCAYQQRKELSEQDLTRAQDIECRLIPMLMAMRNHGVRIDRERLARSKTEIGCRIEGLKLELRELCGEDVAPWEAAQIGKICDRLQIAYPRTYKTNAPSFTTQFLENSEHIFLKKLLELRSLDKIVGTFLEGQLENYLVNGRIHPIFRPEGTVTGRFSCEHPNAQFFPARDEELSEIVRGVFTPEEGNQWLRFDYSQIEYRLLVHFATGPGAQEARQKYIADSTTDYHTFTQELLKSIGVNLSRKPVKNLNFGLIYGQGVKKTARVLGLSDEEAKDLQKKYHTAIPFAKKTMEKAIEAVTARGYVRTLNGRRRRFDTYEPISWFKKYNGVERVPALPYEAAIAAYGPSIERANAYRALNSALQGSAGEITKRAMVDIWEAGICDVLGPPHLTVHDELDISANIDDPVHREAVYKFRDIMENSTKLKIPITVTSEIGPNWGNLKEF